MSSIINSSSIDFELRGTSVYINSPKTRGKPGILLFWANWCGHCHRFIPTFKELAQTLNDEFKCVAVEDKEINNNPKIASALAIKGYPTIKFFDQNGKIIGNYPDNQPRDRDTIMKHVCKTYHHCIKYH